MPSTDDRVVAMHFDNVAFERKVADTIASMDKLKTSLDLTSAAKGLGDLKAAGHNFDLSGMSSAIDNVSSKFSAMGAVAFSVINTIVSQATTAGIQLGKALSLDQTIGGFREYETNMNSIQTIMANTRSDGTTLDQVGDALNQLNEYSDRTIYNFSQMAKNIGTFTAAGVDLDTSVGAIKGIANLAAVSGSSSEQASSAMYQLSQALASGKVRLIDWISVRNAGMGGEVFQKALFETGKAMGSIEDAGNRTFEEWTKANEGFAGSLEKDWLTTEVLTATLQGFTGDLTEAQLLSMGYTEEQAKAVIEMGVVANDAATKVKTFTQLIGTIKESIGSGWAQTFKIIFGDFEEARTLFTGFSDFFKTFVDKSAESRNKLLEGWEKLGGRDLLIQSLMYGVKALTDLLAPLKEAFREIFPKKTSMDLYLLTLRLRNFLRSIQLSEETMDKLKRIFKGVFSAISIGIEVVKGIFGVFKTLFNALRGASDGKILSFFAGIADKITALRESLVKGGGIARFFEELGPKIVGFATTVINKFKEMYAAVKNLIGFFNDGFTGMGSNEGEGIQLFANKVGMAAKKVVDFFKELIDWFGILDDAFKGGLLPDEVDNSAGPLAIAAKLGEAFRSVKDFIMDAINAVGSFKDKAIEALGNFKDKITETVSSFKIEFPDGMFSGFKDKVAELVGSVSGFAGGLFEKIFGDDADEDIKKIEGLGDKLGVAGDKLKAFNDKITSKGISGKTPGEALGEVSEAMKNLGDEADGFGGVADTLQGVWDRISSGIDGIKSKFEEFISFVQGIVGGSEEAAGATAKGATKGGPKTTDSVGKTSKDGGLDIGVGEAAAGGVFAGILVIFRDLRKLIPDLQGMFKRFTKAGTKAIEELTGVFEAMQLKLKAEALKDIGKAIALIVASMVVLSLMDTGALITASTAIGVVVAQLVGAMALLSKFASGPAAAAKLGVMAASMVAMAGAVFVMALAAKIMAGIDTDELIKGIAAITVLLGALALSADKLQKLDLKGASGLFLFAYGLKKIADAVLIFGKMDLLDLAQGMGAVVVALFLLADFTDHLPDGSELFRAGAGIALIALGLNLMATAVKIFATMDLLEMGKGLLGVGAAVVILMYAMNTMPKGPGVLASAAAFVIMAFALQMLSTSLSIIAALSTDDMTKALIGLGFALGILAGAAYLMQSSIGGAVAIAIMAISLSSLAEALVLFADIGWGELVSGLLKMAVALGAIALVSYLLAPAVLAIGALGLALLVLGAGFALIGAGAKLIAEALVILGEAGSKGIENFLDLCEGLIELIPKFIGAIGEGLIELGKMVLKALPGLIENLSKVIGAFLDLIIENVPKLGETFYTIILEFLRITQEAIPELVAAGFAMLMGLLHGIEENIGEIVTTVANIITNFLDALALKIPQIIDSVYNFIIAVIKGVVAKLVDIGSFLLPKGLELLQGLWNGMIGLLPSIGSWVLGLPAQILGWLGDLALFLWQKGIDLLAGLFTGLVEKLPEIMNWFIALPGQVLGWLGDAASLLLQWGTDMLQGLWNGAISIWNAVVPWVTALPGEMLSFLGDAALWLLDWGTGFIQGLWDGAIEVFGEVTTWVTSLPGLMLGFLLDAAEWLLNWGKDFIRGLWKGAKAIWELVTTWVTNMPGDVLEWLGNALDLLLDWGKDIIRGLWKGVTTIWELFNTYVIGLPKKILGWVGDGLEVLKEFGKDVIRGLWAGIDAMRQWIWDKIAGIVGWVTDAFGWVAEIFSPSRVMMWYGNMLGEGLIVGIDQMKKPIEDASAAMGDSVVDSFDPDVNAIANKLTLLADQLSNMEEFNPTITPVLDLTNVEQSAARMGDILGRGTTMAANLTYSQAAMLSAQSNKPTDNIVDSKSLPAPAIKFEQNNYSPTALSTADIYRQTRNQIALAKEALAVP